MKEYPLYRIISLTGILAAVLNTLIIIILDFTVPNYNFVTQYVSEFGVIPGKTSIIVSIWWVLHGLLLIVFSVGLNNSIDKAGRFSILGPLFISFYGLFDSIGSVIFPMLEETLSGVMHNLVSFIGVTAVIFSPISLLYRLKKDPLWARLTRFNWVTQGFFWIIYVICLFAFAEIYFTRIVGILQRVFIFAADAWIIVLSYRAFMITIKHRRA